MAYDDAYDDSYDDSYDDAYDNTYDDAYDDTYDDTYDDAYDDAYDNAYDDAYDDAYNDTYEDTYNDAYIDADDDANDAALSRNRHREWTNATVSTGNARHYPNISIVDSISSLTKVRMTLLGDGWCRAAVPRAYCGVGGAREHFATATACQDYCLGKDIFSGLRGFTWKKDGTSWYCAVDNDHADELAAADFPVNNSYGLTGHGPMGAPNGNPDYDC